MKLRNLILTGCVIGVSACTGFDSHSEVKALNEAQAVGSPFTQYLAAEYREFANNELDNMFDYPDALHFARKGLAAANGNVVMPEPVSDWNLLPSHMEELSTARGRLIVALDLGARDGAPQQAAVAQAAFDCWIEQQEENWQNDDIVNCKTKYLNAIAALEGMIAPAPAYEPEPELVTPAVRDVPEAEPMKPEDAMYLVFFDFDESEIGAGGQNVLDAVAEEFVDRRPEVVRIVGHTDSSGSQSYNEKLAMRRANAVRDGLANRGVDPAAIMVDGRGENELLVETADDVREPANRRTEITFE